MPALAHYGRLGAIESHDYHGKWVGKMRDWQAGVAKGVPAYQENHRFDAIVVLPFPELAYFVPLDDASFYRSDPNLLVASVVG